MATNAATRYPAWYFCCLFIIRAPVIPPAAEGQPADGKIVPAMCRGEREGARMSCRKAKGGGFAPSAAGQAGGGLASPVPAPAGNVGSGAVSSSETTAAATP